MSTCPACYGMRKYCRKCKKNHCLCSWAQCRGKDLPKAVVHYATSREAIRFGVPATIISTLCGRSNRQSKDGMNSSGEQDSVTCKFCLALIRKREER
jgi:hypothetical protein